jgi:hypothetical protein
MTGRASNLSNESKGIDINGKNSLSTRYLQEYLELGFKMKIRYSMQV